MATLMEGEKDLSAVELESVLAWKSIDHEEGE